MELILLKKISLINFGDIIAKRGYVWTPDGIASDKLLMLDLVDLLEF
ncbi:hypothetical protein B6672_004175 [Campylobacter jejuni]